MLYWVLALMCSAVGGAMCVALVAWEHRKYDKAEEAMWDQTTSAMIGFLESLFDEEDQPPSQ